MRLARHPLPVFQGILDDDGAHPENIGVRDIAVEIKPPAVPCQ